MSEQITDYYHDPNLEDGRLSADIGPIEWQRTLDIFERFLPPPPGTVLDIGGATGDTQDFARDQATTRSALDFMRQLEEERSILGVSPHIMGLARKIEKKRRDHIEIPSYRYTHPDPPGR